MNHLYTDFAKNTQIENCFFHFIENRQGNLKLDSIYTELLDCNFGVILSYEQSLLKNNFIITYKKGSNLLRKNFSSITKEIIKNRKHEN